MHEHLKLKTCLAYHGLNKSVLAFEIFVCTYVRSLPPHAGGPVGCSSVGQQDCQLRRGSPRVRRGSGGRSLPGSQGSGGRSPREARGSGGGSSPLDQTLPLPPAYSLLSHHPIRPPGEERTRPWLCRIHRGDGLAGGYRGCRDCRFGGDCLGDRRGAPAASPAASNGNGASPTASRRRPTYLLVALPLEGQLHLRQLQIENGRMGGPRCVCPP